MFTVCIYYACGCAFMKLTFLGTSCMVPSKDRGMPSVFLQLCNRGFLFDCGEGTQRQLKIAGIKLSSVNKIFVSHWHGDHVLGIPGIVQSMGAADYAGTLEIYGPRGSKEFLGNLFRGIIFDFRINIKVIEIENSGIIFEDESIVIEAQALKHNIPCFGFSVREKDIRRIDMSRIKKFGVPVGPLIGSLQRGDSIVVKERKITPEMVSELVRGRKVSYMTDTSPCPACIILAEDSDVMICESAFTSDDEDKARAYGHMTARESASMAKKARVKMLALFHFSGRYKTSKPIEDDAKKVFENVVCARDFLNIEVARRE